MAFHDTFLTGHRIKFQNLFPPYVSARISNWIYPFSVENANQSMVHEAMTRSALFGHSTTLIMDLNSLISDYMVSKCNITIWYHSSLYSCCFIYCILYSSVLSGFKPEKSTWYDSWTWMQSGFDRRSFQIFSYEPWFHSNDIRISPTIFLWWKRYDHFLYICWYFAEYLPKSESH